MYRLFPCIPIFRCFFIKSVKECVYVIMLKIALLLVKIYILVGKKGISGLLRWVTAKPTTNYVGQLFKCNGKPKLSKELKSKYNLQGQIRIINSQIIHSIPKS